MRWIRWFAVVPFVVGALFGWLAIERARLPYNSEGVYFDSEAGIVSRDSAVVAYAALAAGSLFVALVIWFGVGHFADRRGSSHGVLIPQGTRPARP